MTVTEQYFASVILPPPHPGFLQLSVSRKRFNYSGCLAISVASFPRFATRSYFRNFAVNSHLMPNRVMSNVNFSIDCKL